MVIHEAIYSGGLASCGWARRRCGGGTGHGAWGWVGVLLAAVLARRCAAPLISYRGMDPPTGRTDGPQPEPPSPSNTQGTAQSLGCGQSCNPR